MFESPSQRGRANGDSPEAVPPCRRTRQFTLLAWRGIYLDPNRRLSEMCRLMMCIAALTDEISCAGRYVLLLRCKSVNHRSGAGLAGSQVIKCSSLSRCVLKCMADGDAVAVVDEWAGPGARMMVQLAAVGVAFRRPTP